MAKRILTMLLATSLLAILATASADVIVFTNKFYEEGTIKEVTENKIVLEQKYGSVELDRKMVAGFYYTTAGKKGEEYYQAGLTMLKLGDTTRASLLFEKAAKYNKKYYGLGRQALSRTYSKPTPSGRVTVSAVGGGPAPGTTRVRVQCKFCNGTGKVDFETGFDSGTGGGSGLGRGTGIQVKVPVSCFACGGQGYKILDVPKGYGICPDCGGIGMVSGDKGGLGFGGGSTGSGMRSGGSGQGIELKNQPTLCLTCGGKGYVVGGTAVASAQQAYGPTGGGYGSGSMRAHGSGGSERWTRTRSWEDTEPEAEAEEQVKEEAKKEEEPKGEEEKSWFKKNLRWVFIGGGAVLLVVAIAASKMGGKNKG